MTRSRPRSSASALLLVLVMSSSVAALSLVSVQEEIQIGQEAQKEIRSKVPELRDAAINRYIDSIGRRLAAQAPGPKYPYSFSVADYRELNAFALPGGPVWIHRGVLDAAQNESQVAGVLAHEVSHIAKRHAAAQLTKATVTNGLLGLLGAVLSNDGTSRGEAAARIGAGLFAQGLFLKFSRDDERDADRTGVQIMRRAGWDPRGLPEFLAILAQEQRRSPGSVEVFLSSHPAPGERVGELQSIATGGGRRTSEEFQQIKRRLASLPAARAMPSQ